MAAPAIFTSPRSAKCGTETLSDTKNEHTMPDQPIRNVDACPIAICGMACRLPGGLTTPRQLWDFIIAKGDARSRVPASRYNVDAFYSPVNRPASVVTEYGYFLDESVELGALDTTFFSMRRSDVEGTDPQERLMLEIVRECIEDAGITGWKGKSIGCYIGSLGEDWLEMSSRETQRWGSYKTGDFLLSNRISYEMNWQGPSMTIRTACSAAMVGLNEACMAISRGDCEGALVGGTNLIMSPGMTTMLSSQGVLSKDGSCKTFSAEADGYARGEALAAIYIKPLESAQRDGNPIRAVIRATAVNHDGKTQGIYQPSYHAQEALIRTAYRVAGISDFGETAMVECHGTGTPTGDPIEAKAITSVFGKDGVYIGSVKPNIGHSEGASGIASIIKMVLALENRIIPPNIKFMTPNPEIPFEDAHLCVPTEALPWPQRRQPRVSINSFGVGGTNAHVILDSADGFLGQQPSSPSPASTKTPRLLLYSATTAKSLTKLRDLFNDWARVNLDKLDDLSYTLAHRREHLPLRTFTVIQEGAINDATDFTNVSGKHHLIMIFTGQGAQWPQMGRELFNSNDIFQSTIRSLDGYLRDSFGESLPYSIEGELLKTASESCLSSAAISQPLCTALQLALVDVLKSINVTPFAVVGHSSGEIAAAYAAGSLTAPEAITIAHYRGVFADKQQKPGSMVVIGLAHVETQRYLTEGVSMACHNSPKSTTISGDTLAVQAVVTKIKESHPGVFTRMLFVDKAYHSSHMAEVGDEYQSSLDDLIHPKSLDILFYSSVTGERLTDGHELGPSYWKANLISPVLFSEAVDTLLRDLGPHKAVFLEIGPHSALAGPLRQIFSSRPYPYVSAMLRNRDSLASFLTAVGTLYNLGFQLDLQALIPGQRCLPDLPRYPWNHEESYWLEPRVSKEWRLRKFPYHNLLGARIPESADIEPSWRNLLHVQNIPWVRDHKVGDNVVLPFAGYLTMVGEAVSQITGEKQCYGVRNVSADVALVLFEAMPTEIITAFHPFRLSNSQDSDWWDFTVTSFNGHVWTKHCTGQVTARVLNLQQVEKQAGLYPRNVGASAWYKGMHRVGVNLGPCFQTLSEISTMTTSQSAICRVINGRQGDEHDYHIHPTALDVVFQLPAIAAVNGRTRLLKNWIPVSLRNLTVRRCDSDMEAIVSADLTSNGCVNGQGCCTFAGDVAISFSGVRLTPADGAITDELLDTHAAARLEWRHSLHSAPSQELVRYPESRMTEVRALEELSQLHILSTNAFEWREQGNSRPVALFKAWAAAMQSQIRTNHTVHENEQASYKARILELEKGLCGTQASYVAKGLRAVHTRLEDLTAGGAADEFLSSELIEQIHQFIFAADITEFLHLALHHRPGLRILEIGIGTTSLAESITKALTRTAKHKSISRITSTSSCFKAVATKEPEWVELEYKPLDINKDLSSQDFEGREYDLIIARFDSNQSTQSTVIAENFQKLLSRRGRLVLQDMPYDCQWVAYLFGTISNWSLESLDSGETTLSKLVANGFQIDKKESSSIHGSYLATTILKRNGLPATSMNVTFLRPARGMPPSPIMSYFQQRGYKITECDLTDTPPHGQDVISLLDEGHPFLDSLDETVYMSFNNFLHRLQDSGIIWITPHSQMECNDPRYGEIIGLARTLRSEMLLDFATCEVDDFHTQLDPIIEIFKDFQQPRNDHSLKPDFEYAIKSGYVYIGRYYPFALGNELTTCSPSDRAVLKIDLPGRFNTMRWMAHPREKLQADEIELEVHIAGLNYKDILVARGIIELPIRQLGSEIAGVVTRVGQDVKKIKVGDRVCCPAKEGLSSVVKSAERFCARVPENLSFEEAGTMIVPFGTVLYSLINIGRLEKGQSILIHSACGGVGLAAIQVARMIGAEIYATVGTEEKALFLMEKCQIPRSRIFSSRSTTFHSSIMSETAGRGIDLVLNSLAGELLHASWQCVAEFGTMIEIGKRDLLGDARLDMRPFLDNRTLVRLIFDYYEKGLIQPIHPIKIFGAQQIDEAFQYMQKGKHIGRIGIAVAPFAQSIARPTVRAPTFPDDASYLLVGGLGGIGRALSVYMAEHGAREFIYLSRSAGATASDDAFACELQSLGCDVFFVQGDVCDMNAVTEALGKATRRLKGVVQLSMVLRDQSFSYMTFDQWKQARDPKIKGTWNLHYATSNSHLKLDFFVLCSSIAGQIGQPGQANYASANSFLDAFAQYRNSLGLAASVVDIGAVEDVGAMTDNQGLLRKMKANGLHAVSERELLDAFMVSMFQPIPSCDKLKTTTQYCYSNQFVIGLGPVLPLAVWKNDRRMSVYTNSPSDEPRKNQKPKSTLMSFLATVATDPSILKSAEVAQRLSVEIGVKLADMLLKSPDEMLTIDSPLAALGMDSLVAAELRAWWRQVFGFEISVREMLGTGTLSVLGRYAANGLLKQLKDKEASNV
ncbi:putative polyketide synthase [Xylaria sp. FL0043]|nr:putative polyketide synthase [Xylaria sp. FL0043]